MQSPPHHDENQEDAEQPRERRERRARKQQSARQRKRNRAEREPAHHAPVDLAAIEPDPAPVADELRDREDRNRFAHAEYRDEHGQQYRGPAEAGHSGERRRHETYRGQQQRNEGLRRVHHSHVRNDPARMPRTGSLASLDARSFALGTSRYIAVTARSRTAVASVRTLAASDDPFASPSICDASCVNAVRRASPAACSAVTNDCLTDLIRSADSPLDRSS